MKGSRAGGWAGLGGAGRRWPWATGGRNAGQPLILAGKAGGGQGERSRRSAKSRRKSRCQRLTVFAPWWGPSATAGSGSSVHPFGKRDTPSSHVRHGQPLAATRSTRKSAPVPDFRLLAEPGRFDAVDGDDDPPPRWRRVSLSCFSAGYGAVREILKDPTSFDRVDAIVAADSIYAGLDETPLDKAARRVDPRDMAGFLAFARPAADAKKVFVVTHSAQPTPYASTTETADDLLASVGLERSSLVVATDAPFPQVSRAGRGGFAVLGFAGASGPAHLFHLRSIDRWWQVADRLAAAGHEPR